MASSTLILLIVFLQVADARPPPIFILGDSTVDVGTNTHLPNCTVRADFPMNGIDFPASTPTGRFSNGFNVADFIAKYMGHNQSPPPFLFLDKIVDGLQNKGGRRGVNFASGGSGLLDATFAHMGVVPLSEQMKQFTALNNNLTIVRGAPWVQKLFSKSFFCISTGSNDIFWYFKSNSTIPKEEYIGLMVKEYRTTIEGLYRLGARKFGLVSLSPVGCCPVNRLLTDTLGCYEPMNDYASTFHSQLLSLMGDLSSELEEMEYAVGDVYRMTIDSILDPTTYNFKNVEEACCGHGELNGEGLCDSTANICLDHHDHMFWDLYHASEAASEKEALNLFLGPKEYVTPINFATLIHHNSHQVMIRSE